METKYNIGEKIYLPYTVDKISIGKDKVPKYELSDNDVILIKDENSLFYEGRRNDFFPRYLERIRWIEDGVRDPTENGDYLVTVEDDYGNMGGVIRTVEVSTYYTTDGDGETYAGWQTSSRVIAWADIPLEAYDGDYK